MKKLWNSKAPEWLVFCLFGVFFILISAFHEPWFDEAQAWMIARDASLKEILFTIPHYEGHPPLWHLILAIPARLGVPFEWGLKTLGALIALASAWLLLFRSRLPRLVRLCLPFHYFFFYQYGVVTRPYGLMMLIMLLIGMQLPKKDAHPLRLCCLLGLLCLCSAYGLLLAGGIALCMLLEILKEKGFKSACAGLIKDPRTRGLLGLLVLALLLAAEILPRPDTYYAVYDEQNPFILCLLCSLLIFPAECFITSSGWFGVDRSLLQTATIERWELGMMCVVGIVFWVFIICSASKKTLKYLLIPYGLMALFAALVYFSGHHLGVVFMFFLFWGEYVCRQGEPFAFGRALAKRIVTSPRDKKPVKALCLTLGAACLAVPLVWTGFASVHEVQYEYFFSQETAAFIAEHGLDNCSILSAWHESGSLSPFSEGDGDYVNTVMLGNAVPVNAYFDRNIFYTLNQGDPDKGFMYHRRPTLGEARQEIEAWRAKGAPEVIMGKPDLKAVFGDEISYRDYTLVALIRSRFIWKTSVTSGAMTVFVRSDLVEQYGLEPLDGIEYAAINGIPITDEIRKRYAAGEPIEEILKPYLDAIFGEE